MYDLSIAVLARKDVQSFVKRLHYLHTMPTNISLVVGLLDGEKVLRGVALFGPTSYNTDIASFVEPSAGYKLLELRRFVLDHPGENVGSWFLSRCLKRLPADVGVVVSHADSSQGHVGYLYQACNFSYKGTTSRDYHYADVKGTFVHKRIPWQRARDLDLYVGGKVDEAGMAEQLGLIKVGYMSSNGFGA